MSIIHLDNDNFNKLEVVTNYPIKFSSGSAGTSGTLSLFNENSNLIKKEILNLSFVDSDSRNDLKDINEDFYTALSGNISTDLSSRVENVLTKINNLPASNSNNKSFNIIRFETPFVYDVNYAAYVAYKNLNEYYRKIYRGFDFSFTNYNSINFFTSSEVPSDSCFIYLAKSSSFEDNKNPYLPESEFTFDFYINPRYSNDYGKDFKAGTIFFMSSSYSISLVSGSSKDANGLVDGYRILLQLSQSVDKNPDNINLNLSNGSRSFPDDLIFVSSDNSLKRNSWHHVAIKWGSKNFNFYTGSIVIDNIEDSKFVINSGSISSSLDPNVLLIGSRYEGRNSTINSSNLDRFFNATNTQINGTKNLGFVSNPNYSFVNPLNAEVHDLKIFSSFRDNNQIYSSSIGGQDLSDENLKFYLPPFFVKESPKRLTLVEPYSFKSNNETTFPFEVTQSMGLRSRYINLENYLRDFSTGQYPIPFALTGSIQSIDPVKKEVNDILYNLPEIRKRNLTILPNDNGKFRPDFNILLSGSDSHLLDSSPNSKFVNDFDSLDLSKITLRNVIEKSSQEKYVNFNTNIDNLFESDIKNFRQDVLITNNVNTLQRNNLKYLSSIRESQKPVNGLRSPYADIIFTSSFSLDEPGRAAVADNVNLTGSYFEILSRGFIPTLLSEVDTKPDAASSPFLSIPYLLNEFDSQELYFFNIPSVYYGEKIEKKSFNLIDKNISGSGKINVSVKDDGFGQLFRSDCLTEQAYWNSVGNIFYDEGLVVIKNPLLPNFGKNGFEMEFSGSRTINVLEFNIPCPAGDLDLSVNPTYKKLKLEDGSTNFSYITGLNLHDRNLNIIGKITFSQPLIKKVNDKFVVRAKMDF